jgi:hypothetical protein
MPIAKITGPGLAAIGISVAMLWGCVISEGMMVDRAFTERARVMHDVQLLQRGRSPEQVSSPLQKPHRLRTTAG